MGFREDTSTEVSIGQDNAQTEAGAAIGCLIGISMSEVSARLNNLQTFVGNIGLWNIGTDNAGINSGVCQFNGGNLLARSTSGRLSGYLKRVEDRMSQTGVGSLIPPAAAIWISNHTGPGSWSIANMQEAQEAKNQMEDGSFGDGARLAHEWLETYITNGNKCLLMQCTIDQWGSNHYNSALSKFIQLNNEFENSFFCLYLLCDIANQFGTGSMNWFHANPNTGLLEWESGRHDNSVLTIENYTTSNIPFRNDTTEIQSLLNELSSKIDNEWEYNSTTGINKGFTNAMRLLSWRWSSLSNAGGDGINSARNRTGKSLRFLLGCMNGNLNSFLTNLLNSLSTPTVPCSIDFAGAGQIPSTISNITLVTPRDLIDAMLASEDREIISITHRLLPSEGSYEVAKAASNAPPRLLYDYEDVRESIEGGYRPRSGFMEIASTPSGYGMNPFQGMIYDRTPVGGTDAPFISTVGESTIFHSSRPSLQKYPPYTTRMGHFLLMKVLQGIDKTLSQRLGDDGDKEDIYKYLGIHYCFSPCRIRNSPCPFEGSHADDHVVACNDNPFGTGAVDLKVNTTRFYNAADQLFAMPNFFDIYVDQQTSNHAHARVVGAYLLTAVFKTLCSACTFTDAIIYPEADREGLTKPNYDTCRITPRRIWNNKVRWGQEFGFDLSTRGLMSWLSDIFGEDETSYLMINGGRVRYADEHDDAEDARPGDFMISDGASATIKFNKEFNVMLYIPQELLDIMEQMGHLSMHMGKKATHGVIIMNTATTHKPNALGGLMQELTSLYIPDVLFVPDAVYLFPDKTLSSEPLMHISNRRESVFKGLYDGDKVSFSCTSMKTAKPSLEDDYPIYMNNHLPIRDRHHYFSGFNATFYPPGEILFNAFETYPLTYMPGVFASYMIPLKNVGSRYYNSGFIVSGDADELFPRPELDIQSFMERNARIYRNDRRDSIVRDIGVEEEQCTDMCAFLVKPNTGWCPDYLNGPYYYLDRKQDAYNSFHHVLKNNLVWRIREADVDTRETGSGSWLYRWSVGFSSFMDASEFEENLAFIMGVENFEPILTGAYSQPRSVTVNPSTGVLKERWHEDSEQFPLCWFLQTLDSLFPMEGYPNNPDSAQDQLWNDTSLLRFETGEPWRRNPATIVGISRDTYDGIVYSGLWGTAYSSRLIGCATFAISYPDYVLDCSQLSTHFAKRYWLADRTIKYPSSLPFRLIGTQGWYEDGYVETPEPGPDSGMGISTPLRAFMNVYMDSIFKLTRILSDEYMREGTEAISEEFLEMHFAVTFKRGIIGKNGGEHCGFRFREQYYEKSEFFHNDGVAFDVTPIFDINLVGEPSSLYERDTQNMNDEIAFHYEYFITQMISEGRIFLLGEKYDAIFLIYARSVALGIEKAYLEELKTIDSTFVTESNGVYTVNGNVWKPQVSTHMYNELFKIIFCLYYWRAMFKYRGKLGQRIGDGFFPLFRDISIENVYNEERREICSMLHMHVSARYFMGYQTSTAGETMGELFEDTVGDSDYETRFMKKSYINDFDRTYNIIHNDNGLVMSMSLNRDGKTDTVLTGKMAKKEDGEDVPDITTLTNQNVGPSSAFTFDAETLKGENFIFSDNNYMKHIEVMAKEIAKDNTDTIEEARIRSKIASLVIARYVFGVVTKGTSRRETLDRSSVVLYDMVELVPDEDVGYESYQRYIMKRIFYSIRDLNTFKLEGVTGINRKMAMWRLGWKEEYTEVQELDVGTRIDDSVTQDIKWENLLPSSYQSARDVPEETRNNLIATARAVQEIMDSIRSIFSADIEFHIGSGLRPNDDGSHHQTGQAIDFQVHPSIQTREDLRGWPFCVLRIIENDEDRSSFSATRIYWEWRPTSGGDGWFHVEAGSNIRSYGNPRGTSREIRLGTPIWDSRNGVWKKDTEGRIAMAHPHYVYDPPPDGSNINGAPWRPPGRLPAYGEEVMPSC